MAAFARARTMFAGLPCIPSLSAYPQRNWKEAGASAKVHGLPSLGIRLPDLAQRLQVKCRQLKKSKLNSNIHFFVVKL